MESLIQWFFFVFLFSNLRLITYYFIAFCNLYDDIRTPLYL